MKLQDLVTSYLSVRLVRPPTARTYHYYVRRVIEHTGKERVDDFDVRLAIQFRDKLLETSVGVTWNSARRHLIALWKHAESIHLVSHNPWRELRAAQVRSRPKTILDSEFEKAKVYIRRAPDSIQTIPVLAVCFFNFCLYWDAACTTCGAYLGRYTFCQTYHSAPR